MRVFWIIVGIVALIWLGFLHFDRNEIRLDLDNMNKRIDGIEQNGNFNNELGDEVQDIGEEINEGIQPNKENRLRDDIQDNKEELREEKREQKEQPLEPNENPLDGRVPPKEVPAKNDKVSMNDQKAINAFLQQPQPKMVDYEQEAQEAYVQDAYTYTTIAFLPIEDEVVPQ